MVAEAGKVDIEQLAKEYLANLMTTLKQPAKVRQHVNVLQHLLGYLKGYIDKLDREEMVETIEQYRRGLVPLIVPITTSFSPLSSPLCDAAVLPIASSARADVA